MQDPFLTGFINKEEKIGERLSCAQLMVWFACTSLNPCQADHKRVLSQLIVLLVVSTLHSFSEELGKQC